MKVVVTTGAIGRAKLQSNHHHQQTNIQFFTDWMPFLSPNQQCQSTEGKFKKNRLADINIHNSRKYPFCACVYSRNQMWTVVMAVDKYSTFHSEYAKVNLIQHLNAQVNFTAIVCTV